MAARLTFVIAILHTWVNVASSAEVPAKFLGVWTGSAGTDSGENSKWTSYISIIGGKGTSPIGVLHLVSSSGWGSVIQLGLREKEMNEVDKKSKIPSAAGDVLLVKEIHHLSAKGYINGWISGEFNFTNLGDPGQFVATMAWINRDGDVTHDTFVVQERVVGKFMAEKYLTCRGGLPPCKKRPPKKG